ncbi:3'-5' exonuclease-like [Aristolochia californica]|uniref:3'-5' exonuclease-like n=1 Tax=Aristolochia californica TaxID=171875 RepID=UPI0035DFDF7A
MPSPPTSPIVKERRVSSDEYQRFTVSFQKASILTVLTNSSSIVDKWIHEVYHAHQHRIDSLVVGLDVEWRASYVSNVTYPVAILQLCVGRRCLIFQFLYADNIPESLYEFLAKPNFSFVGVGVKEDARKLDRDYGLVVNKPVELPALAADIYEMKELRFAGLKKLTNFVLGYDVDKPKEITMSRWDYWALSHEQVSGISRCKDMEQMVDSILEIFD